MMDAFVALLISIGVLIPFAFIGKKVQTITKFILPFDFITISTLICLSIFVFVLPVLIPMEEMNIWGIPAISGYILGYILSSRKDWMMIVTIDPAVEPIPIIIRPIMPYTNKHGQLCIQEQKNIELAKRLFYDIHHTIFCNGKLEPDMVHPAYKDPLFMWLRSRGVLLDFIYVDEEPQYREVGREHKRKVKGADGSRSYVTFRKRVRVYHTEMYLPEPACSNPIERLLREDAHRKDIRELRRITMENIELQEAAQREYMVDTADLFIESVVKSKPSSALHRYMKEEQDAPDEEEYQEEGDADGVE